MLPRKKGFLSLFGVKRLLNPCGRKDSGCFPRANTLCWPFAVAWAGGHHSSTEQCHCTPRGQHRVFTVHPSAITLKKMASKWYLTLLMMIFPDLLPVFFVHCMADCSPSICQPCNPPPLISAQFAPPLAHFHFIAWLISSSCFS